MVTKPDCERSLGLVTLRGCGFARDDGEEETPHPSIAAPLRARTVIGAPVNVGLRKQNQTDVMSKSSSLIPLPRLSARTRHSQEQWR